MRLVTGIFVLVISVVAASTPGFAQRGRDKAKKKRREEPTSTKRARRVVRKVRSKMPSISRSVKGKRPSRHQRYRYDAKTRRIVPVVIDSTRRPKPKELPLGATPWGNGVAFLVWAPKAESLTLAVGKQRLRMRSIENGYYTLYVPGVEAGARYGYQINGEGNVLPDPVSHWQPKGEMGLSQVADHTRFRWTDKKWKGLPLSRMDITETHVGTVTKKGTFRAAKKAVKSMVANTVELMPVHQFPGSRNWGYDPAQVFAVQRSYGAPDDLRELVNSAHRAKKAMLLDVVYNHPGPVGAFSGAYGPYFEGKGTPWGSGLSVDGPHGREVRRHFIENALMWLNDYHFDGLRLDATEFIPTKLLREMRTAVDQLKRDTNRKLVLISEHNLNDRVATTPLSKGGHGFDGQWSMDLQYALRALLAKEKGWRIDRYAKDPFQWTARAVAHGWAYEGQNSAQDRKPFGTPTKGLRASSFVVAKDDHDQIGNTPKGARLGNRIGPRLDRAVDGLYAFLPFTVMNFQGDDYRAKQPFDFFVDVKEPLAGQIREGRNRDWGAWSNGVPFRDPNAASTFEGNKLDPKDRRKKSARRALRLSTELARIRTKHPALQRRTTLRYEVVAYDKERTMMLRRSAPDGRTEIIAFTNLSDSWQTVDVARGGRVERLATGQSKRRSAYGTWSVLLNSEDKRFGGRGAGPTIGAKVRFSSSNRTLRLPPGTTVYLERALR